MKLRRLVVAGVLVSVFIGVYLLAGRESKEQRALEETRRNLRQAGFKIALSEFNFFAPEQLRTRAKALTNSIGSIRWYNPSLSFSGENVLMSEVGSNTALVFWKRQPGEASEDAEYWTKLRQLFDVRAESLNQAAEAALSGPFQFDLNETHGPGMLLLHAATLRNLSQMLGERAMLNLHDGHYDAAWTNVLATTRIVTAWDVETIEIPNLVRYACFDTAYDTIWQALQCNDWPDDRLAKLQHEVEAVNFFRGLPDAVAFSRASMANLCQQERQMKLPLVFPWKDLLHSPRNAWANFNYYRRQLQYRDHGTFEEEKELLLFYRDRETELRRAVQSTSWAEMRQLPGITNQPFLKSNFPSRTRMVINQMQMSLGSQRGRHGLAARAASAEAQRRVITTAIALTRFHHRAGSYPETLAELSPEFLPNPPMDFMDGQPLRYHRTDDGRFLLYSVGLDCVDNGGRMKRKDEVESPSERFNLVRFDEQSPGVAEGTDLVWPLPATEGEIEAWAKKLEEREAAAEAADRADQERAEANRQGTAALLLNDTRYQKTTWSGPDEFSKVLQFKGQPLVKLLLNTNTSGTNAISLDEMFRLKEIVTSMSPEIAAFELPMNYDVMMNVFEAGLRIALDRAPDGSSGGDVQLQECQRATNGDCLLLFNATVETPGRHAVQAVLSYSTEGKAVEVRGPVTPYFSTNICQFEAPYSEFDNRRDFLYAKLPESNGVFSIEIKTGSGEHVKTLNGSTTNGVIDVEWNLLDEHGQKCTNNELENFFSIRLPDSGRSQTMKQFQHKQLSPPSPGAN